MFEDATMESGGRLNTRSRYYTIFGALLNGAFLAGMVLIPLLHPEALPRSTLSPVLLVPPPPPPPPVPHPQPARVTPAIRQLSEFDAPTHIPKLIRSEADPAQPSASAPGLERMEGVEAAPGDLLGGLVPGTATAPLVRPAVPRRVLVSQGVMAGYLLSKPQPVYPAIARAARIADTVVLSATISKEGTIANLTVVSGPPMLAPSAMAAVQTWRYRPFQLNAQPVEVQTLIRVTFTLGS